MTAHSVFSVKTYLMVFAALIALTALTTAVDFVDLGPFNAVIALGIAFTKMMLVAVFFMHLLHSTKLMRIVVLSGFFWLAILISGTFSDYITRPWTPDPPPWSSSAPPSHP